MGCLTDILIDSGKFYQGVQKIKAAIRLCPFPLAWFSTIQGVGLHLLGDHEAAIPAIAYAIKREPKSYQPRVWLISALVETGRLEEAAVMKEKVMEMSPTFSVASWTKTYRAESHSRLKDNLNAAGLPD